MRTFSAGTTTQKAGKQSLERLSENFLDGTSANYVEQMYAQWQKDPSSVHASWSAYFSNVERGAAPGKAFVAPPQVIAVPVYGQGAPLVAAAPSPVRQQPASDELSPASKRDLHIAVQTQSLIRAFQVFGHRAANLDPLGIKKPAYVRELDPATYNLTEDDLNTVVSHLDDSNVMSGILSTDEPLTVREIISRLRKAYCGNIGVEFMHIPSRKECNWIRERFELRDMIPIKEDRKNIFLRLVWATKFENFLGGKFLDKRFGADGAEVIIPGMKTLIDVAADLGVQDCVIGMAHRGRLNVLANVLRKPMAAIFHEFQAGTLTKEDIASGDVKYHLGTSYDRPTRSGKMVHLSLAANPSHLEAVNPLVEGKVKAKLISRGDTTYKTVLPLLVHGDASFAGQGVVYETITMSALPKYSTGGTIHVILNNQIGFTTDPEDSRPGEYCTDVAKTTHAPIMHVNGDDPDAVCWAFKLAAEWRQTFHTDFVVDIVAYRRFGHNEVDQPSFTQPLMYKTIEKHPSVMELYAKKLLAEGVLTQEEIDGIYAHVQQGLEEGFAASKTFQPKDTDWLANKWKGFKSPEQTARIKTTGVPMNVLKSVGKALSTVPEGFNLHPVIRKSLQARLKMINGDEPIDWATAEALAFGTLLSEGFVVRLAGQDVERGTFSHRHAVVHDQVTGDKYNFFNNIPLQRAYAQITNSLLSEFAALGFEVGYTLNDPNALVMWEGQFGDFANGAQIIIDQFISSGEQKWMRQSGIVLLLPHGYEGMGPEHSSARLERFLQMSDQDPDVIPEMDETNRKQIQMTNWQVVNCTTPANYFHVLRRQMHREFRKPLIVMTPKVLLRHPRVKSPISAFDDIGDDTRFQRVIPETEANINPATVKRVFFCSGKVYWDLFEERMKRKVDNIALVRVEQLAPFPFDRVIDELKRYAASGAEVFWVQEEPKNMGAWTFMYFNFRTCFKSLDMKGKELSYIGRKTSASPATGSTYQHKKELARIMEQVFSS